jgi:hypothetical protein
VTATVPSRLPRRQLPGRNRSPLKLHVDFGGIGVRTDINVSVRIFQEKIVDATSTPTTRLLLEWEAATMPALFPLMKGAFRTR